MTSCPAIYNIRPRSTPKFPLLYLTAHTLNSRGLFTGLKSELIQLVGEKMAVKSIFSVGDNKVNIVLKGKIRIKIEGDARPDIIAEEAFEKIALAIEAHYQVTEINIAAGTCVQQNGALWLDIEISLYSLVLEESLVLDNPVFMHPGSIPVTSNPHWHDCPRTFVNRPELLRDNFDERI